MPEIQQSLSAKSHLSVHIKLFSFSTDAQKNADTKTIMNCRQQL